MVKVISSVNIVCVYYFVLKMNKMLPFVFVQNVQLVSMEGTVSPGVGTVCLVQSANPTPGSVPRGVSVDGWAATVTSEMDVSYL